MQQEKYKFTWDTYPDYLREIMKDMMTSADFMDVTLVSDDKQTIKAHRNILCASSPVFKNILQLQTNNNHPVIYLRGIKYSEIESMMQFIYLGEATCYQERTNELLFVLNNLEIKELCTKFDIGNHQTTDSSSYQIEDDEQENIDQGKDTNTVIEQEQESHHLLVNYKDIVSIGSKFQCPQCAKLFSQKCSVYAHIRYAHENVKSACSQCGHNAPSQRLLKIHIQTQHEGVKYVCTQCQFQATTQSNLTQHIKSKHEGIKYACNQCDKKFTRTSCLAIHVRSIHECETFACNLCEKQFTQQANLTSHIQSIHKGVKHLCNQCDYQTIHQGNLSHHIRRKHCN